MCVASPLIKLPLRDRAKGRLLTSLCQSRALQISAVNDPGKAEASDGDSRVTLQHLSLTWEQITVTHGQAVGACGCRLCRSREICNSNSRWHSPKTKTSLQGSSGGALPVL